MGTYDRKVIKDNALLVALDSEVAVYCMLKDKNLSEVSYLEFRKHMYSKYYTKEDDE